MVLGIVVVGSSCKESVDDNRIELAIAIKVHRPYELRTVVIPCQYLVIEIELEPDIRPRLSSIPEGSAQIAFHSIDNSSHCELSAAGHRRGLVVRFRERCGIDFGKRCRTRGTLVEVIASALGLFCQFTPRH